MIPCNKTCQALRGTQQSLNVCLHAKLLQSCLALQPCGLRPIGLLCPWGSSGENAGVGCQALLQGVFPIQGSNPHLSPALAGGFFTTSTTWGAPIAYYLIAICYCFCCYITMGLEEHQFSFIVFLPAAHQPYLYL